MLQISELINTLILEIPSANVSNVHYLVERSLSMVIRSQAEHFQVDRLHAVLQQFVECWHTTSALYRSERDQKVIPDTAD